MSRPAMAWTPAHPARSLGKAQATGMAIQEIIIAPDPVLRKKAARVDAVDDRTAR